MSRIDLEMVRDIVAELAAAEIMPLFRRLKAGDVEMKGVNDPVTVADRAMEAALARRLIAAYPGSLVIGEERCAIDATLLSRFDGEADVWVIDPIDGTRNFVEGKPEFGVMLALVRNKQTVCAWIHDPNSGDTLIAEQGGGVTLRGEKLRLAGHEAVAPKVCLTGPRMRDRLAGPALRQATMTLFSWEVASAAAFNYGRLFTGVDLFARSTASRAAFLFYRQSKPWDHVPGLLMLSEAGGYAADLTGCPYDMQRCENGLLIAPNEAEWESVHQVVNPLAQAHWFNRRS